MLSVLYKTYQVLGACDLVGKPPVVLQGEGLQEDQIGGLQGEGLREDGHWEEGDQVWGPQEDQEDQVGGIQGEGLQGVQEDQVGGLQGVQEDLVGGLQGDRHQEEGHQEDLEV